MPRTEIVNHQRYGDYTQTVYDTVKEAGHQQLASEGRYGWGMPTDHPTEELIRLAKDKVIFDLGCGWGNAVTVPSLLNGAALVFAADITPAHVSEDSPMRQEAKGIGRSDSLKTLLLHESWWDKPLSSAPSIPYILDIEPDSPDIPIDESVDFLIARHALQFGNPETVIRFLDFASVVLKENGSAVGINFTPYTNYMYKYDSGVTMQATIQLNEEFAQGNRDNPGGYLHPTEGTLRLSLSQLMKLQDLDRGDQNSFLYFDEPTIQGMLRKWGQSRQNRGLPENLRLKEGFYFTPPNIATINKLVNPPEYKNMENYVFYLTKVTT